MAYYNNFGAFSNNLYPAPNYVMANAQILGNQISQAGYSNFNGLNGCLPLQNNYQYPPGYGYMPGFATSGGNGYMFGQTDVNYTANANGVNYSYSSGPSTLDYINVIGTGLTSAMNFYYANKVNQQSTDFQQRMTERMMDRQDMMQDYAMSRQQKQDGYSDLLNSIMMIKMLEKMDKNEEDD